MKTMVCVSGLLLTSWATADVGGYDHSFGVQGVNFLNISGDSSDKELAWDITQASDNKYYLGGFLSNNSADGYMILARFNEDGTLDTDFHFDGYSTANFNLNGSTDDDAIRVMHLTSDGVFLAGYAEKASGLSLAIAKFDFSGNLDTGFSSDGLQTVAFSADPAESVAAYDLTTDDLGFVYVAGGNTGSSPPVVAKLLPNGSLDNSFNLTGKVSLNINGWNGAATGIHVDDLGGILITGSVRNPSGPYNNEYFAAKLLPSGSLDTTFNAVGYKIIPIDLLPEQSDESLKSIVDDSGRIYITGATINGADNGDYDMAVVKLNPDGSFDNTFGINGKAVVTLNSGENAADVAYDLVLQEDGKLVLCGFSGPNFSDSLPTYVRLMADGSRDLDFADFGVSILPSDPLNPMTSTGATSGCILDHNGQLVTSLSTNDTDTALGITRVYLGQDLIFEDGFE